MTAAAVSLNPNRYFHLNTTYDKYKSIYHSLSKLNKRLAVAVQSEKKLAITLAIISAVLFVAALIFSVYHTTVFLIGTMALAYFFYFIFGLFRRGKRFLGIFLLINPGIFIYAFYFGLCFGQFEHIHLLANTLDTLIGIGLTLLICYSASRFLNFYRLKKVKPQIKELDYINRICATLMQEAPKNQKFSLTFNPFQSQWSEVGVPLEKKRSGYTLSRFYDLILEFDMLLNDQSTLHLAIHNLRTQKIKNRKNKYKGNKHRMIYSYHITYPIIPDIQTETISDEVSLYLYKTIKDRRKISERKSQSSEAIAKLDYAHFHSPSVKYNFKLTAKQKPGKIYVRQVFKSATMNKTQIDPHCFIAPIVVLETIRYISSKAFALQDIKA